LKAEHFLEKTGKVKATLWSRTCDWRAGAKDEFA